MDGPGGVRLVQYEAFECFEVGAVKKLVQRLDFADAGIEIALFLGAEGVPELHGRAALVFPSM